MHLPPPHLLAMAGPKLEPGKERPRLELSRSAGAGCEAGGDGMPGARRHRAGQAWDSLLPRGTCSLTRAAFLASRQTPRGNLTLRGQGQRMLTKLKWGSLSPLCRVGAEAVAGRQHGLRDRVLERGSTYIAHTAVTAACGENPWVSFDLASMKPWTPPEDVPRIPSVLVQPPPRQRPCCWHWSRLDQSQQGYAYM